MPVAAGLYYFAHQTKKSTAPPVLLLHGAGGSHLSWPSEIRRLGGYEIYAPDLPGHGKSDTYGEQTISAYANHVLAWMEAINQYRAFIVGHSMGAAIALMIAHQHPARVAGLGLLGIGTPLEVPPEIIENLSNPAMVSAALNHLKALSFGPDVDPRLVDLVSKRLADMRASVLRGDFLACARFNIEETLSAINQPTIVIAGAKDQMMPLRYTQLLAKKINAAVFTAIPEAGHMFMLEKPGDVAERLDAFLRQYEFFV